jgi:alcohol dehydrogenase
MKISTEYPKDVNTYIEPKRAMIGAGSAKLVGEVAKDLHTKKALLVTDKVLRRIGTPDEVKENLSKTGIDAAIFDETEPNPRDYNVEHGLKMYKDEGCDFVVSVGGGSPHDCAKAVGLVANNGGSIRDYEGVNKSKNPMVPMVAVNTTAGTGAEMTQFCIIKNTDTNIKMAIIDWHVVPDIAINDPISHVTMPSFLTACTGLDALTHAIEAFVSRFSFPATDAQALGAIKLISEWLSEAVSNGDNFDARNAMAYAEYMAGDAFSNAGLGIVHAMAHTLGGIYDLPHGQCNAIILPYVMKFNLPAKPDKFAQIAKQLGVDISGMTNREAGLAAVEQVEKLKQDVGVTQTLGEIGLKEEDIERCANFALKDASIAGNPREAKVEDIIELYKKAL